MSKRWEVVYTHVICGIMGQLESISLDMQCLCIFGYFGETHRSGTQRTIWYGYFDHLRPVCPGRNMILHMFLVMLFSSLLGLIYFSRLANLHFDILSQICFREDPSLDCQVVKLLDQGSPTAREGWPENMVGSLSLRSSIFKVGNVMHHVGGSLRLHAQWLMTHHQCINHEA